MALYYSELLTAERIAEISDRYGFSVEQFVEKFVMCLEIHKHMAQEIDCVTRGGMCMPFHQPNFEVRRMSQDIDILTSRPVDAVERAIDDIDGRVDGLQCRKINPTNPLPIEGLVSYNVLYDSCFGRRDRVKVDMLCGADLNPGIQRVQSGSRIMGFEIQQELAILSRGALAADKITSLALGTIGVAADSRTEIIKQIYDIAVLLRQASVEDLAIAYGAYHELTEFKVGRFGSGPYTTPGISSSIVQSLRRFLTLDTNALVAQDLLQRFAGFRGSYISGLHPYQKSQHIADVMLVLLFALSLQRHTMGAQPPSQAGEAAYLHSVLTDLGRFEGAEMEERCRIREEYLSKIPGSSINKRLLTNSPVEHVYLIQHLQLSNSI